MAMTSPLPVVCDRFLYLVSTITLVGVLGVVAPKAVGQGTDAATDAAPKVTVYERPVDGERLAAVDSCLLRLQSTALTDIEQDRILRQTTKLTLAGVNVYKRSAAAKALRRDLEILVAQATDMLTLDQPVAQVESRYRQVVAEHDALIVELQQSVRTIQDQVSVVNYYLNRDPDRNNAFVRKLDSARQYALDAIKSFDNWRESAGPPPSFPQKPPPSPPANTFYLKELVFDPKEVTARQAYQVTVVIVNKTAYSVWANVSLRIPSDKFQGNRKAWIPPHSEEFTVTFQVKCLVPGAGDVEASIEALKVQ